MDPTSKAYEEESVSLLDLYRKKLRRPSDILWWWKKGIMHEIPAKLENFLVFCFSLLMHILYVHAQE